jgi:uncharacterized protein YecT (DUF1311 family)
MTHRIGVLLCCGLVLWSSTPAHADSQLDLNRTACEKYEAADRKLNDLYQAILKDKDYADADFRQAFMLAQRLWIRYREAEVEAAFPGPRTRKTVEWGSVYPMCRCSELENITRQRIEELEYWHTARLQEGDVCGGTRKRQ